MRKNYFYYKVTDNFSVSIDEEKMGSGENQRQPTQHSIGSQYLAFKFETALTDTENVYIHLAKGDYTISAHKIEPTTENGETYYIFVLPNEVIAKSGEWSFTLELREYSTNTITDETSYITLMSGTSTFNVINAIKNGGSVAVTTSDLQNIYDRITDALATVEAKSIEIDSVDFYKKSETYSKNETDGKIEENITIKSVSVNGSAVAPDSEKNVDISVPMNYAKVDETNTFTQSQTFNGDVHIKGDIIHDGTEKEVQLEKVLVEDNTFVLRSGSENGLSGNEYVGIIAKNYDGTNDGALLFDNNGTAYVGDISYDNDGKIIINAMQPLATRSMTENLGDGQVAVWNSAQSKFVGSSNYPTFGQVYTQEQIRSLLSEVYTHITNSLNTREPKITHTTVAPNENGLQNNTRYDLTSNLITGITLVPPTTTAQSYSCDLSFTTGETIELVTSGITFKGRDCLADGTFDIQPNTNYYLNFMKFGSQIIGLVAVM